MRFLALNFVIPKGELHRRDDDNDFRYLLPGLLGSRTSTNILLRPIIKPWSGRGWAIEFVGIIHSHSSKQHKFIIVATNFFTKWIETEPLKVTLTNSVRNFIFRNIISRFGIPKYIVTDRGAAFMADFVVKFLNNYGINLLHLTPYYDQSNGQRKQAIRARSDSPWLLSPFVALLATNSEYQLQDSSMAKERTQCKAMEKNEEVIFLDRVTTWQAATLPVGPALSLPSPPRKHRAPPTRAGFNCGVPSLSDTSPHTRRASRTIRTAPAHVNKTLVAGSHWVNVSVLAEPAWGAGLADSRRHERNEGLGKGAHRLGSRRATSLLNREPLVSHLGSADLPTSNIDRDI
ncbi:hypothetical protein ACLB2K_032168 [Fragaria x ananassa]